MYVIEKPLNNIILLCFLKGNLRVFYEREPREHVSLYLWKCALHGNQIVPRKSGHFLRKSDAVEFGGTLACYASILTMKPTPQHTKIINTGIYINYVSNSFFFFFFFFFFILRVSPPLPPPLPPCPISPPQ